MLSEVIEIVHFIKTHPVKSRILSWWKDMDYQHVRLLLQFEVWWLSKGKVVSRVHQLQNTLLTFSETEEHERFCNYLKNYLWLSSRLEYLTEIFRQLNRLNGSMQGRNENILTLTNKLVAFTKKVTLRKSRVKLGTSDMFPLVRKPWWRRWFPSLLSIWRV